MDMSRNMGFFDQSLEPEFTQEQVDGEAILCFYLGVGEGVSPKFKEREL